MRPDCVHYGEMIVYLSGKIEMIVTTNFRNPQFQNSSPHCTFGSFNVLNGVQ